MADSYSDARKAEHSPLQLCNLRKRTSDISIFYDTYLGTTLDHFPSSKLPLQRAVLRRYRSLLTVDDAQQSKSDMSTTITAEIIPLWESSCIPTKNYRGCWDAVKQCVTMWVDAKQDVKKTPAFQNGLDILLDLRPTQNRSLSSLRDYLKMAEWEEDYKLFKGQLKHPQTGTISSTKDVQLQKKVQKTAPRQAKASSYIERNQDELSASTSSNVTPKNVFDDVCEDNILLVKSHRQCTLKETTEEGNSTQENSSSEEDWNLPLRLERVLTKKTEELTLTLPSKKIPELLAGTNTVTKLIHETN